MNWMLNVLNDLNTYKLCELDEFKMLGKLRLYQ